MNHHIPPAPDREELENASWVKASRSNGSNGCVEVAHVANWTAVRDSKNPAGPVQLYTVHEWDCFLDGARNGEFDRTH